MSISIPLIDLFEIFKETDNSKTPNLTEESIYKLSESFFYDKNRERIPVFSGSTSNEGIVGFIPKFTDIKFNDKKSGAKYSYKGINYYKNKKEGCITLVADGKAGFIFYRSFKEYPIFAMNISSLALFKIEDQIIKQKHPDFEGLSLKWFYTKFFDYFNNLVNKSGVSHFTKEIYEQINLDIPEIKEQEREFEMFQFLFDKKRKLITIGEEIDNLKDIHLTTDSEVIGDYFFNIFDFTKGTHGFTELAIYYNLPELKEEKIPFWGGDITHKVPKRYISPDAKNVEGKTVRYFNEKECIILTVDGASAGSMTYKDNIKFTLNHHAGVLVKKEKYKDKLNIKWFSYKFENTLKSLTVSTGSKTLSNKMLGYFYVEFYKDIKKQNKEAELYNELRKLKSKIYLINNKISNLMIKNIAY